MFTNISTYCKESYDELVHKTTWPTQKMLANSAVIVLSASVIIALLVFGVDTFFETIMKYVYAAFN